MTRLIVWAAGSLRGSMTQIARRFREKGGQVVETEFGPSGVLRRRIEQGERPDLLASADQGHPARLHEAGLAGPPRVFAHNRLCAVGRLHPDFYTDRLIEYLLQPQIRLGTSTPGADPGGDYAWRVFDLAETLRPGAGQGLRSKALTLVGGPANSAPIRGQSPVVDLFDSDRVDAFIGYRTTANQVIAARPDLVAVDLPEEISLRTDCALAVLTDAAPGADRLADFILGPEGQDVLRRWGFEAA